MQIIPLNLDSVLLFLHNSKLAYWMTRILHFTVLYLVAWPLNESETGVDLILIETSLHFM